MSLVVNGISRVNPVTTGLLGVSISMGTPKEMGKIQENPNLKFGGTPIFGNLLTTSLAKSLGSVPFRFVSPRPSDCFDPPTVDPSSLDPGHGLPCELLMFSKGKTHPGWWLSHPSETFELVSWDD